MGNSCCGLPLPFGTEHSPYTQPVTGKRKMNYSKPTHVTRGVNIKKNPQTGLYEGVPKQWMENNEIDINVDSSKTIATSHFSDSIRPTIILPPKILNTIDMMPSRQTSLIQGTVTGSMQTNTALMRSQQLSYPIENFLRR